MEAPFRHGYLGRMDSETRAAFAAQSAAFAELSAAFATQGAALERVSETMTAGSARVDRYFELQQKQFLELRDRVDAVAERLDRLEHEVSQFRDYVTRELPEIRLELRELRGRPGQTEALRREIADLAVRVERLERRRSD